MNDLSKACIDEAKQSMQSAINFLEKELAKIRAGKANPGMLDGVKIDYYGTPTEISQAANINTPDARSIIIQPWEKTIIGAINKAILDANLGFTPRHEGDILRIVVPPLTEERRKELCKAAKVEVENSKVNIRNARRNVMDKVKKLKDKSVPEDEVKQVEKEIQDITDKFIGECDKIYCRQRERDYDCVNHAIESNRMESWFDSLESTNKYCELLDPPPLRSSLLYAHAADGRHRPAGQSLSASVVGIGLNVNETDFPDWVPNPVSLKQAAGETLPLGMVLERVVDGIAIRYRQLAEEAVSGHFRLDGDYQSRLLNLGVEMPYLYRNTAIRATIRGVNRFGHLELVTHEGESIVCQLKELVFQGLTE